MDDVDHWLSSPKRGEVVWALEIFITMIYLIVGKLNAGWLTFLGGGLSPVGGPVFCILDGPTRGRAWSATGARAELRHLAAQAGVRRCAFSYAAPVLALEARLVGRPSFPRTARRGPGPCWAAARQ